MIRDGGILKMFNNFTYLRVFHCDRLNYLTAASWKGITRLPHIYELIVQRCNITDQGVECFAQSRSIVVLKLIGCKKLSENSIMHVSRMYQLKSLCLAQNNNMGR